MGDVVLDYLFGERRDARFQTLLSVDAAVRVLSEHVETSRWGKIFQQHMYGHVSEKAVYLERMTPLFKNSWRPVFQGAFEASPQGAVLVGRFGPSTATRGFTMFGVGFGMLWSIGAGCSVLTTPQDLPFWFPFAGLGMSVVVVALGKIANLSSAGDIPWLVDRIQEALGVHAA